MLLLVHDLTAKEVFAADTLMEIDTALEWSDALFTDGRHAEARDAFAKAAGEIGGLVGSGGALVQRRGSRLLDRDDDAHPHRVRAAAGQVAPGMPSCIRQPRC